VDRDERIDTLRGVALIAIYFVHIPWMMGALAWSRWGFSSAFELFVFLSGYVAGIACTKELQRNGMARCTKKIYRRVFQVYLGHIVLFLALITLPSLFSFNSDEVMQFFNLAPFFENPWIKTWHMLLLIYQPKFLDILPIYIIYLLVLPFLLVLIRYSFLIPLILTCILYTLSQFYEPIRDLPAWSFNPFSWQLFFVTGLLLSVRSDFSALINAWVKPLLIPAMALVLFAFLVSVLDFVKNRVGMEYMT